MKNLTPYEKVKAWRERNPQKIKAQRLVYAAMRNGTLKKKPCEKCGAGKVHAHHTEYSRPLDVQWLCPFHHGEAHRELHRKEFETENKELKMNVVSLTDLKEYYKKV